MLDCVSKVIILTFSPAWIFCLVCHHWIAEVLLQSDDGDCKDMQIVLDFFELLVGDTCNTVRFHHILLENLNVSFHFCYTWYDEMSFLFCAMMYDRHNIGYGTVVVLLVLFLYRLFYFDYYHSFFIFTKFLPSWSFSLLNYSFLKNNDLHNRIG